MLRQALFGPLQRGGEQGLLHGVLGAGEVAVAAHDRAEHLRRQRPQQVLGLGFDVRFALAAPKPLGIALGFGLAAPKPLGIALGFGLAAPKPLGIALGFGLAAPKPLGIARAKAGHRSSGGALITWRISIGMLIGTPPLPGAAETRAAICVGPLGALDVDDPEAGQELLRLGERAVGDFRLARLGRRPHHPRLLGQRQPLRVDQLAALAQLAG